MAIARRRIRSTASCSSSSRTPTCPTASAPRPATRRGTSSSTPTKRTTRCSPAQRQDLREPYRTLIGHLRHEAGHYYWNLLIRDRGREEAFRTLFGDEGVDYAESLRNYYAPRAADDWREHYISEYATMHPWEDWAESFAHYLHMVDGVETGLDLARGARPAQRRAARAGPARRART